MTKTAEEVRLEKLNKRIERLEFEKIQQEVSIKIRKEMLDKSVKKNRNPDKKQFPETSISVKFSPLM